MEVVCHACETALSFQTSKNNNTGIFLGWIIFSFVVGFIGSGRKIGFAGAFFLSLLLSPLIRLIIALVSKDKETEQYKKQVLETQQQLAEVLKNIQNQ
ncbi:MAG: hypothetical protein JSU03_09005 [Bacteroidetes bacterium]|nr:hypothetical protein [Bacteroidota bacterium]